MLQIPAAPMETTLLVFKKIVVIAKLVSQLVKEDRALAEPIRNRG